MKVSEGSTPSNHIVMQHTNEHKEAERWLGKRLSLGLRRVLHGGLHGGLVSSLSSAGSTDAVANKLMNEAKP